MVARSTQLHGPKVACPDCGQQYLARGLAQHRRYAHPSPPEPFDPPDAGYCPDCDAAIWEGGPPKENEFPLLCTCGASVTYEKAKKEQ